MDYCQRAKELREETVSHRRYLHTNAEVGLEMPKAVAYVIGWYEGSGRETLDVPSLQAESALLEGLLNLFFSPEEQVERERFLERVRNLGVVSKRDL